MGAGGCAHLGGCSSEPPLAATKNFCKARHTASLPCHSTRRGGDCESRSAQCRGGPFALPLFLQGEARFSIMWWRLTNGPHEEKKRNVSRCVWRPWVVLLHLAGGEGSGSGIRGRQDIHGLIGRENTASSDSRGSESDHGREGGPRRVSPVHAGAGPELRHWGRFMNSGATEFAWIDTCFTYSRTQTKQFSCPGKRHCRGG